MVKQCSQAIRVRGQGTHQVATKHALNQCHEVPLGFPAHQPLAQWHILPVMTRVHREEQPWGRGLLLGTLGLQERRWSWDGRAVGSTSPVTGICCISLFPALAVVAEHSKTPWSRGAQAWRKGLALGLSYPKPCWGQRCADGNSAMWTPAARWP